MKGVLRRVANMTYAAHGLRLVRPSLDHWGRAILACVRDGELAKAIGGAGEPANPTSALAAAPYELTVIRYQRGWEVRARLLEVLLQPHVQPLPNGKLLVVGPYCRRDLEGRAERNARVYGPEGRLDHEFVAGDGIEDVQSAADGATWISYMDQGTMGDYGRHGWGRIGPDDWVDPVGFSGLLRVDPEGSILFEYQPPAGLTVINDCYALNAWGNRAWISYHPGFPIARIDSDGTVTGWPSSIPRVDALAVDGELLLLYVGLSSDTQICRLVALDDDRLEHRADIELELSDGAPLASLRCVIGRGPSLHAFSEDAWYRIDVDSVRLPV